MKKTVILMAIGLFQLTASADTRVVPLMEGERFWGGCVTDGRAMPLGATNTGERKPNCSMDLASASEVAWTASARSARR